MTSRIAPTHCVLLAAVAVTSVFLAWSSIRASFTVYNLIVVAPVSIVVLVLVAVIAGSTLFGKQEPDRRPSLRTFTSDLMLLGAFAVFCIFLTTGGFDVATFLFVWIGVVLCGERRIWLPPLFAAVFTVILVYGFGAVFPFPMRTLVI